MKSYLGLDIGTSAVKALLVNEDESVLATASVPLATMRPKSGWSEQNPQDWWQAAGAAMTSVAATASLRNVAGIGLSGQMHSVALLDQDDRVIRPAILWNDARAVDESDWLNEAIPDLGIIAGVPAMPGFTAPKLLWLARHEPQSCARLTRLLQPKDYIRLKLTGEYATDMSEASGTLWLDVARRDWADNILQACRLSRTLLPRLLEGNAISGYLLPEIAARWGLLPGTPVAAGAGDAAAAAIGLGVIGDGDGLISLGTSAQYFIAASAHRPAPRRMIHAYAHALPGRWSQTAALLNGASCLSWAASLFKGATLADLIADAEAAFRKAGELTFLPYLVGERSPLNDPHARGVLYGLTPGVDAAAIMQAVMEGVAFALADGQDSLAQAGIVAKNLAVTGGGAKNGLWMRILASVLNRSLTIHGGTDYGPALGAARLARLSITGEAPEALCHPPPRGRVIDPEPQLVTSYAKRLERFRALYRALKPNFRMDS